MAVFGRQLNRFERMLFGVALFLGGLLIVARVGLMVVLAFLRHAR
jgi:hypothetical protein